MTQPAATSAAANTTSALPTFEIYDFNAGGFDYANTFERAVRIMRRYFDAKITRLSDNVVLAQTRTEY